LGRGGFHLPDLERFNFLITIFRAAGKASAFTLKALLDWPDFTARSSAIRLLIRVPQEIFDVLDQSENLVLSASDFASSSPLVKEKAAFLATQNLNSLDLCHAFFLLNDVNEDQQTVAMLREEFRNNVELLTLAGSTLPVIIPTFYANFRNPGLLPLRTIYIPDFNSFSEHRGHINSFSPENINSILLSSRKPSSSCSKPMFTVSQESVISLKK
jgi:hypothetical protein